MTTGNERRPIWLYWSIACAIPVVLLLLLEGVLRLGGFGDDYPLFVELARQPDYLQPNPEVIKRFFADPAQAPEVSIDTGYFLAEKPAGGLRIVVQGGSSAAGFPYGKHASPAAILQQRLSRTFPERDVEVILTAMSAVNSYTLLAFADEIVDIEPDAVLVYAGHNEYLGVLGVGSSLGSGHGPALTRAFLKLRDWRLFQLVQAIVGLFRAEPQARSGTLMANVAGQRSIAFGSELFERGVQQFSSNLDALLARYAEAGIEVFIATLASNEKDQAPFLGGPPGGASAQWSALAGQARTALERGDFVAAAATAGTLVDLDAAAADAHFLSGRAAAGLAREAQARSAYRLAIDYDRLRFRAPGVFEQIIRDAAARHGARVVEVHQRFASAVPGGSIGRELMLEHLHPNAQGYYLLASAFHDALQTHGLGLDWRHALPDPHARGQQPLTRIERWHGEYRVAALMNDWPFVEQKQAYELPTTDDPELQIAQAWYRGQLDWLGAMNQGLLLYQRRGDYVEASRIAMNIAEAFRFEAQPQHLAGQMLVRQTPPQGQLAIPYFHRAATLEPRNGQYLGTLARAYLINGYPGRARDTAQRLLQVAPGNEIAREIIRRTEAE